MKQACHGNDSEVVLHNNLFPVARFSFLWPVRQASEELAAETGMEACADCTPGTFSEARGGGEFARDPNTRGIDEEAQQNQVNSLVLGGFRTS